MINGGSKISRLLLNPKTQIECQSSKHKGKQNLIRLNAGKLPPVILINGITIVKKNKVHKI
jgi:hypothetical protein